MQQTKPFVARSALALHRLDAIALVRAINEIWTIHAVRKLADVPLSFDWSDFTRLGIEKDAWEKVKNQEIEPTRIFFRPRVLFVQPQLLEYYRSLALLSQKDLSKVIGGSVARIEAGKVDRPAPDLVTRAVVAINSILSAVVTTAADIGSGDLRGFQFAAAGATIQGSWNNAVGKEGERAVGTILLNNLRDEIR